jgi:rhamnose utilization protein RhaD (predicted bifunctional aldolase and dehydrogenase)
MPPPQDLVELAHSLTAPTLDAAILAEGNVSAACSSDTFWVKASGQGMSQIGPDGFCEVHFEPLLAALDSGLEDEADVRSCLNAARVDASQARVPSTEAFMHAYLLRLPEIRFVAHTHPTPLLSFLCLDDGEALASKRLFPDEIVLCGAASAWVPYVAPGLPLAREIRASVLRFVNSYGVYPKTIWLQNHGLITLGKTAKEAQSATEMSVKAARVVLGALHSGREVRWLSDAEVQQIANWPDEHYRQRLLWE